MAATIDPSLTIANLSLKEGEPSYSRNLQRLFSLIVHHVNCIGRRPLDFFQDFDPLRSGNISCSQFKRGLCALLEKGPMLNNQELDSLINEYAVEEEKKRAASSDSVVVRRVDYKKFLENLEQQTRSNNVPRSVKGEKGPKSTNQQLFKHVKLGEADLQRLTLLFFKLSSWVRYHGASLKSWFQDFDRHHNGLVTHNQYCRSLPPHLLTEDETELLFKAFQDRITKMFHYVRLNAALFHFSKSHQYHEIHNSVKGTNFKYSGNGGNVAAQALSPAQANAPATQNQSTAKALHDHHVPIGTENLLLAEEEYDVEMEVKGVEQVEDRIKKVAYKRRIRISEFCRDFDRLNKGVITKDQFDSALHMSGLEISRPELAVLLQKYAIDNNNSSSKAQQRSDNSAPLLVNYRAFCHEIDTIFTYPDLERHPTQAVAPPASDFLIQTNNKLSNDEELRFNEIIQDLRRQIAVKRISVGGFFTDFDKGQGSTGRITKSHLSRVLSTLSLLVSEDDLFIIFKKYEDHCGDVTYRDFVSLLEAPEKKKKEDQEADLDADSNNNDQSYQSEQQHQADCSQILQEIRYFVRKNRIRVQEFFRDSDQLRLGSIRQPEFISGINRMGFPLTEHEAAVLCRQYKDQRRPECAVWKQFALDVDDSPPPNLERHPDFNVAKSKAELQAVKQSPEILASAAKVLQKCHRVLKRRPVLLKPHFRDFDRTGSGHVTLVQARQCFTYGRLELSEREQEDLINQYGNLEMMTFDYLSFVRDLDELSKASSTSAAITQVHQNTISHANAPAENAPTSDTRQTLSNLLFKLKSLVKSERFRYFEHFMRDLDPLNHWTLSPTDFSRSLLAFPIPISASDVQLLAKSYASPSDPQRVNYRAFCQELESVFTLPEWEKFPKRGDINFVPSLRDDPCELSKKEQEAYQRAMTRLATQLYQRRMELYDSFEDYDKLHNGSIPSSHFKSVLANHNLLLFLDQVEDAALMKRFRIHQKPDAWVDYGAFCEEIGAIVEKMGSD